VTREGSCTEMLCACGCGKEIVSRAYYWGQERHRRFLQSHNSTHRSADVRFWEKVNKDGPIPKHRPDLGPCWQWVGCLNENGYGHFRNEQGKTVRAHLYSLKHAGICIPEGKEPDHLCRNRACVRPEHMEVVTRRINLLRGNGRTAENASKTHCPQGHPYDESNTRRVIRRNGLIQRQCKACDRDRNNRRYREIKRRVLSHSS